MAAQTGFSAFPPTPGTRKAIPASGKLMYRLTPYYLLGSGLLALGSRPGAPAGGATDCAWSTGQIRAMARSPLAVDAHFGCGVCQGRVPAIRPSRDRITRASHVPREENQ